MDSLSLTKLLDDVAGIDPNSTDPDAADLPLLLHKAELDPAQADQHLVALLKHLRAEPDLQLFDGKMQVFPSGSFRVEYTDLAGWLISRASSVGASQAVADLARYVSSSEIPVLVTMAVSGVEHPERCAFGSSFELIPWDQLPESRQKKWLCEQFIFRPFDYPSAALVRSHILPRLHVDGADIDKVKYEPIDYTEFDDILLCCGLIGPIAPCGLAHWITLPEWAPSSLMGYGHTRPYLEGLNKHRQWPEGAHAEAVKIHAAFSQLDEDQKSRLRIPMQRLNKAMRRLFPVDAAIDLGIALESLFLRDLEDDRGELTFRLKTRGARFLGENYAARVGLFRVLGDLYTTRSSAVHTGQVKDVIRGTPTGELLENGFRLASEAIVRLIVEGEPDWNEITLS